MGRVNKSCTYVFTELDINCGNFQSQIEKVTMTLTKDIIQKLEQLIIERFKTISIFFADKNDFYHFMIERCTVEIYQDTREHNLYLHNYNYKGEKILVATWNDNFQWKDEGNKITINYNL